MLGKVCRWQVIRDILESDAIAIVTKEYELRETLEKLGRKPKLVVTDSQVFAKVSADTPKNIMLTSFSILFARYKGDLGALVDGAIAINKLKDNDKVLIAEGCTHHRQADDIATVKMGANSARFDIRASYPAPPPVPLHETALHDLVKAVTVDNDENVILYGLTVRADLYPDDQNPERYECSFSEIVIKYNSSLAREWIWPGDLE